jgi:hypothetical protein
VNQPNRWLDSAANPKIRDLLRSGLADAPDAQALPRTAAALGLGAAVTVVSDSAAALTLGKLAVESAAQGSLASSAAAATATGAAGTALATASSSSVGALWVGKWLAIGFLTGGVASAGLVTSQAVFGARSHEARQVVPSVPSAKRAAVPARSRTNGATPSSDVSLRPSAPSQNENEAPPVVIRESSPKTHANLERAALPAANAVSTARSAPPGKAAVETDAGRGALAAEIAWIDSARRALASGDVNRSLAELDTFERARTLGVLDREAGLLRIDALRKKGDVAGARRVAERYLEAFPGDAHAPRLREFLGSSEAQR